MTAADGRDRALGETAAVAVSAVVGLGVALASTYFFTVWADVFYEQVFRVGPTVLYGGVGSDWLVGNTETWLTVLIKLLHAIDVVMGVFILVMVFVHWGAFRRLADRMRDPTHLSRQGEEVYTDGGAADAGSTRDASDVDGAGSDEEVSG